MVSVQLCTLFIIILLASPADQSPFAPGDRGECTSSTEVVSGTSPSVNSLYFVRRHRSDIRSAGYAFLYLLIYVLTFNGGWSVILYGACTDMHCTLLLQCINKRHMKNRRIIIDSPFWHHDGRPRLTENGHIFEDWQWRWYFYSCLFASPHPAWQWTRLKGKISGSGELDGGSLRVQLRACAEDFFFFANLKNNRDKLGRLMELFAYKETVRSKRMGIDGNRERVRSF